MPQGTQSPDPHVKPQSKASAQAEDAGVMLWDFRSLVGEIKDKAGPGRTYFTDDTLRTLQLAAKAINF